MNRLPNRFRREHRMIEAAGDIASGQGLAGMATSLWAFAADLKREGNPDTLTPHQAIERIAKAVGLDDGSSIEDIVRRVEKRQMLFETLLSGTKRRKKMLADALDVSDEILFPRLIEMVKDYNHVQRLPDESEAPSQCGGGTEGE